MPMARASDGVSGYTLGVTFRLRVLEIEGVAQSLQCYVVGVLQIFHGLTQHFGSGANYLFKILLVGVILLESLAVIESALYCGDQVFTLEGLEQIVVSAATHRVDGHADVVDRRDHDDRQVRALHMDTLQQRKAIALLHHDVGQDQFEGLVLESIKGFATA